MTPEPPPVVPRGAFWPPVAKALRADPGVWYRIDGAPKTSTSDIRNGSPAAFAPPGSFDAKRSGGAIYLRYLGEPVRPWRDPMTLAPLLDERGEPVSFDDLPREPDYSKTPQPSSGRR